MSEWKETTLGEIAEIEMGQSPSGETCNTFGNGIALLNGPTEFGIKSPAAVQFTTDSKRKCKPLDILFCVRGSTTGKMNWADEAYSIGRGLAAIRHKNGAEYRYFLQGIIDYNLDLLLSSATGSTFPNVTRSQIEGIEIKLPPLPEQRAIACILSSLDDKIDLLHRQNATLEKMAETLFRQLMSEHDSIRLQDGQDAINSESCPSNNPENHVQDIGEEEREEWKAGVLRDLVIIKYGKEHKNLLDGKIPVLGSGGIMRYANTALYEKESVLIPRKGTLNNVIYINEPFWTVDTMFYTEMKKPNLAKFVFYFAKALDLASMNVGSAVPSMTTDVLNNLPIAIPPDSALEQFERNLMPFYKKKKSNQTQIRTLTALRDTLLPKLMSGEVRVSEHD